MNDEYYMQVAFKEAIKAEKKGEIPVGAVIVENDRIISKAHNLRDTSKIVTKHAEIIAIEKANKKMKDWRLSECTIYITLQPCKMCLGAIEQSRIKSVVYGVKSVNNINSDIEIIQIKDVSIINKCKKLIDDFFKEIRNK